MTNVESATPTPIPPHARAHSRALVEHPFQRHCGLEILDQAPGRCRTRLRVASATDNLSQALHGGVTYAMIDVTSMLATLPLLAAQEYAVSTSMATTILTAVPRGAQAEFESEVIRAGRTMIVTETKAFRMEADGARTLFATAQISKVRLAQDIRTPTP